MRRRHVWGDWSVLLPPPHFLTVLLLLFLLLMLLEGTTTEEHLQGDIAFAFKQYWGATNDLDWLKGDGFRVIEGIATFWASKAVKNVADGTYSIPYGGLGLGLCSGYKSGVLGLPVRSVRVRVRVTERIPFRTEC